MSDLDHTSVGPEVPVYGPGDPDDRIRTYVDHIYPDCPNLLRMCKKAGPALLVGEADPLGGCICYRCVNKWRREIGA